MHNSLFWSRHSTRYKNINKPLSSNNYQKYNSKKSPIFTQTTIFIYLLLLHDRCWRNLPSNSLIHSVSILNYCDSILFLFENFFSLLPTNGGSQWSNTIRFFFFFKFWFNLLFFMLSITLSMLDTWLCNARHVIVQC